MRNLFISVAIVFLISCSSSQDEHLSKVVIGKWCELVPGEKECIGVMNFLPDGKYEFEAVWPKYNRKLESFGVWQLKGKHICVTPKIRKSYNLDTGTELPKSSEPLESYCDKVVEFEENKIIIDTPFYEEHSVLFRVKI